MKKTKLYLNHAGYCIAKENDSIKGGRKQNIQFHALWGLIEHPEHGYILYDTGYTHRFYEATKRFPNKIYGLITKVKINADEEVANQLKANGISPDDIKHVIITHFHADHVAGMCDFKNATFYTSKTAYAYTIKLPRPIAFSKGVLKHLLPSDLSKRVVFIDEQCPHTQDAILGRQYDLFGDNSILIYDLPGHAAGQIGILLETEKQRYFLIADACWLKRSYQDYVLPNPIVRLFFHSWKDFKRSLKRVHEFHLAHPEVHIVPTHCSATTLELIQPKIDLNVL
jgi:glyoxylase-like metal-dependent hydrolase (beta-lactamase superfamily II)